MKYLITIFGAMLAISAQAVQVAQGADASAATQKVLTALSTKQTICSSLGEVHGMMMIPLSTQIQNSDQVLVLDNKYLDTYEFITSGKGGTQQTSIIVSLAKADGSFVSSISVTSESLANGGPLVPLSISDCK